MIDPPRNVTPKRYGVECFLGAWILHGSKPHCAALDVPEKDRLDVHRERHRYAPTDDDMFVFKNEYMNSGDLDDLMDS